MRRPRQIANIPKPTHSNCQDLQHMAAADIRYEMCRLTHPKLRIPFTQFHFCVVIQPYSICLPAAHNLVVGIITIQDAPSIWENSSLHISLELFWAQIGMTFTTEPPHDKTNKMTGLPSKDQPGPGMVAQSKACPPGMQAELSSIPTSRTFFPGDLIMKIFQQPFSLFRWLSVTGKRMCTKYW